jgi:serine/threonine protein kinase
LGLRLAIMQEETFYRRHGDIKPENILWFGQEFADNPSGILQLADLEFERFHNLDDRSRVSPLNMTGSPTYAPLELTLKAVISRAYDIWSLGCVFLEFITWLLGGQAQVYAFAEFRAEPIYDELDDDTFYTIVSSSARPGEAIVRQGVLL